jgi:ubiquinone/menaquinone biosynthesis C-methylase UbiE
MNFYERRILPQLIDLVCALPTFQRERGKVVPQAAGRVLEVGIGTGRNLPFYRREAVQCVCGVDPGLHPRARRRAQESGIQITELPLSAERIPAEDHSFDCAVCTFSLCTIPDPDAALSEIRRTLKPGGRLLFAEHGAAPDAGVRRWQDRITPYWKHIGGGCHLNREIPELMRRAGFASESLSAGYAPGPKVLTYLYSGCAIVR